MIWKNLGQKGTGKKLKGSVVVTFPDFDNGVIPNSIIDDILNNPGNYQLQFVEPLGFSSEVFGGRSNPTNNPVISPADGELHSDSQIDMVVHAKVQSEILGDTGASSGVINAQCNFTNPGVDPVGLKDGAQANSFYTAFGIWRNRATGAPTIEGKDYSQNGNILLI